MDQTPSRNADVSLELLPQRVQALHAGHIVADSAHAVLVRQAGRPDAFYFPREDVETEQMTPTGYRDDSNLGQASFWTFGRDGQIHENGVWSYEQPAKGFEELSGMMAFADGTVEIHFVEPDGGEKLWDNEARRMGEYIRHTDSGSGSSQQEHWPPNVFVPRT